MKVDTDSKKIEEVLTRGVEAIYPGKKVLEDKMKSGKKLRLYFGCDPSSPRLHLGNLVILRKMAQFQVLGHETIMLIGDFTGMIGDPTEKLSARKKLTRKEVLENAKNYKKIAGKILNFSGKNPAKILYNNEWLGKLSFSDLIELASNFTVQQMITRDMFQERLKQKQPIYLHEFLYPLAQAYDSVAMNIDLEIGGNDQIFNMLCGRDLLRVLKDKEKCVLAMKLLVDDQGKKMGKTTGNAINLDDGSKEMFGKIMSWSDSLIANGFELCTGVSMEKINNISSGMKNGTVNPRDAKESLAKEIVSLLYDKNIAEKEAEEFKKIFKENEIPSEIPITQISEEFLGILDLLFRTNLVSSKAEAKRMVLQGAVKIDKEIENDWQKKIKIKKGMVIQVGKRKFSKTG
jgi:tyrosyl-tRNA synthetase